MSSLRVIRQKLHAVENIKKITEAMERVAAARLQRAQQKAEQGKPYIAELKALLSKLAHYNGEHTHFVERPMERGCALIFSGDKGLCGPYNNNVWLAAEKFINIHGSEKFELLPIGSKAVEQCRRSSKKICREITNWGGKATYHDIQLLSRQLVDWFLNKKYDAIWLIYTTYINVMNRHVVVERFLPIEKPQAESHIEPALSPYLFEPSLSAVLEQLLPRYCFTRLETALHQAYASELSARIIAMQTASKNSEKQIDQLTLARNKMRQAKITEEMIEISSDEESTI